jgi:hypothetical protein
MGGQTSVDDIKIIKNQYLSYKMPETEDFEELPITTKVFE